MRHDIDINRWVIKWTTIFIMVYEIEVSYN